MTEKQLARIRELKIKYCLPEQREEFKERNIIRDFRYFLKDIDKMYFSEDEETLSTRNSTG